MVKHDEYGLVSFLEMYQTDQFLRLLVSSSRFGISSNGSTVVSHEEVNVDVDSDEVRAVDRHEVRVGFGNDDSKTK